MTAKLLVPLEQIKLNSYIEGNAEPAKLRQAVLEAQRVELRGILGACLQDVFLNAVTDDGTLSGLTAVQTTFYDDYLVPLLAKYAEAQFIFSSSYPVSNTGVQKIKGTNTEPASDEAINRLGKRAMNSADFLAQRAKNFILLPENKTDLADFYFANDQNISPQKKVAQGFIYTPYRSNNADDCPSGTR